MTFADIDLPFQLRITFIQLVNRIFFYNRNSISPNPLTSFLKQMVISVADESEMAGLPGTLEGRVGLDLLAAIIDWAEGGKQMTASIFGSQQSLEL